MIPPEYIPDRPATEDPAGPGQDRLLPPDRRRADRAGAPALPGLRAGAGAAAGARGAARRARAARARLPQRAGGGRQVGRGTGAGARHPRRGQPPAALLRRAGGRLPVDADRRDRGGVGEGVGEARAAAPGADGADQEAAGAGAPARGGLAPASRVGAGRRDGVRAGAAVGQDRRLGLHDRGLPGRRDATAVDAHPADAGQRPARLPGRDDVAGAGAVLPRRAEPARGDPPAPDRPRVDRGDQAATAAAAAQRPQTGSRRS